MDVKIGDIVYLNTGKGIVIDAFEDDKYLVKLTNGTEQTRSINSLRTHPVDSSYRSKYAPNKTEPTLTGKPSRDRGDVIAKELRGTDPFALEVIWIENRLKKYPYGHLNPGMQRMCVGNKLRGVMRKKGKIKIGEEWIYTEEEE